MRLFNPSVPLFRTARTVVPVALLALAAVARPAHAQTTLLSQDFEPSSDYTDYLIIDNNDNDFPGDPGWFFPNDLGVDVVDNTFPAQSGSPGSYIAANYQAIAPGFGPGTISTWLLTPTLTYQNGDVFSFYTRTITPSPAGIFPDRLEVRFSANGASDNVGLLPDDVGDFTTLLVSINPTLAPGGYPLEWTQYSATLSGLATPTEGRVAFRYFVTDGGPDGSNSNYIGVDTFSVVRPNAAAAAPEPGTIALLLTAGVPVVGILRRSSKKCQKKH